MNAAEYNARQLASGAVTGDDLLELLTGADLVAPTERLQIRAGLDVDGKLGPDSRAVLHTGPEPKGGLFGTLALRWIVSQIGKGEDPALGNNRGSDIEEWLAADGTGRPADTSRDDGMAWMWCAVLISAGLVAGAKALGKQLPCETSRGALDLARKMRNGGAALVDVDDVAPGDVLLLDRGKVGGRDYHICIVERVLGGGVVGTVEGNVGKVPAKVKRLQRDLGACRLDQILRI